MGWNLISQANPVETKNTTRFFPSILVLVDGVTWYLVFVVGGRWQLSYWFSRGERKLARIPRISRKRYPFPNAEKYTEQGYPIKNKKSTNIESTIHSWTVFKNKMSNRKKTLLDIPHKAHSYMPRFHLPTYPWMDLLKISYKKITVYLKKWLRSAFTEVPRSTQKYVLKKTWLRSIKKIVNFGFTLSCIKNER